MNNVVVDRLENRPIVDHVSDLGALMAFEIAKSVSIPAYACYSAETVELESLVFGILKLLNGEEEAKDYT
jgi:butyrate kinase